MKITRRALSLGLFAPLAAPSPLPAPPETPRQRKRFKEVNTSIDTWDMGAESIESILDTLRETAQVNSVYFMATMHGSKRPVDLYFPRSLQPTKTFVAEDARAHWQPHAEFYKDSRIKPRLSDNEELRKTDYLAVMTAAARKAGCKAGAEISHSVMDMERATGEFIDTIQRDIWGNPLGRFVCYNNPDIRAYLTGMFTDLVANYDIDYFISAMFPMVCTRPSVVLGMGGERHKPGTAAFSIVWGVLPPDFREALLRTTLGGCFCEHCQKAAAAKGLDLKAIRRAMLPLADMVDHGDPAEEHRLKVLSKASTSAMAMLLRHPEIFDLVKFRCMTMTGIYQHLHDAMVKIKPKIDFRLNARNAIYTEFSGLEFASLKPCFGSVRSSDYTEQSGKAEALEGKRRFLLSLRDGFGDEFPMHSAIAVCPRATPELVRKAVVASAECGADGISLSHYDMASLPLLRAISEGLKEADVSVG